MKFIKDFKKLDKIKELAKSGDKDAENFLFHFMEMQEDEANKYLERIDVSEEKNVNISETLSWLLNDENEAVDGYDKAIKLVTNLNVENKDIIISKLEHIKNEELEHIQELRELMEADNGKDIKN